MEMTNEVMLVTIAPSCQTLIKKMLMGMDWEMPVTLVFFFLLDIVKPIRQQVNHFRHG